MKDVKVPYPKTKRFNHICKPMQIAYPSTMTNNMVGTDATAIWTMWIAETSIVIFHCPFCGKDLNKQYNMWVGAGLWEK